MPTIEINTELECPHCGAADWHNVDALVGSGPIPQTTLACYQCKGLFNAEGFADVSVTAIQEAGDA